MVAVARPRAVVHGDGVYTTVAPVRVRRLTIVAVASAVVAPIVVVAVVVVVVIVIVIVVVIASLVGRGDVEDGFRGPGTIDALNLERVQMYGQ